MKSFIGILLLLISSTVFSQTKLTYKDIINKNLTYTFPAGSINIKISSDSTIYWSDPSKPKEANEKSKTIHINDHTVMTAWYESDKTFVNLLSDFEKMKVSGMVCWADGRFYAIEGTIQIKN